MRSAPQALGERGWPSAAGTPAAGRRPSRAASSAANSSNRSRLTWTWVAPRSVRPQQPGAQREERRVGREVAAVEEVPGERAELHGGQYRVPWLDGSLRPLSHRRGAERRRARGAARARRRAEGGRDAGSGPARSRGAAVALVFERPSTRTRVSFEVGVAELGGHPLVLRGDELQLSRGESVARHGARAVRATSHAIVIRAGSHETVAELAAHGDGAGDQRADPAPSPVPGARRPADAARALRRARRARLAYVGDGNNVARSLAIARAGRAGVEVRVATPRRLRARAAGLAALDTHDAARGGGRAPTRSTRTSG